MKRDGLTIKILKTLLLSVMTLNLANCAKDSSSSSTTATTGYYVTNSTCYYNGTAQASLQTCAGATTTYYGYMNSLCYQVGNGVYQQVSTSYCTSTSTSSGYYVSNSVCYLNGTAQASLATCSAATTTSYGYMNGLCYQVGGGVFQQVSTSYCATSSSTNYTQQLCNGYFTDGSRWAYCQEGTSGSYYNNGVVVMDCTGYTLYNQSMQVIKCL